MAATSDEECISDGSSESSYTNEKMETPMVCGQTNFTSNLVNVTANKAVQTYSERVKMFKTMGTQTENFFEQFKSNIYPDNTDKIIHLEDHSYSSGPNIESSTDETVTLKDPCLHTPAFEDQVPLLDW